MIMAPGIIARVRARVEHVAEARLNRYHRRVSMTGAFPHRLARVPSAWADVRTRAIMTAGATVVGTVVALFAFDIVTPAEALPGWMRYAAVFILILAGGLAIDLAGRVARASRGIEPVVTVDAPVWVSGKTRRVHVRHPDVRGLRSLEVRLRASVIVGEEFHESSGERGTRIQGESRHDALLASADEARLIHPSIELVAEAAIPAAAANAGWSWSVVVACTTTGHHQHQYEYPFAVADGGEPEIVIRRER
jgi:hypothetical protein